MMKATATDFCSGQKLTTVTEKLDRTLVKLVHSTKRYHLIFLEHLIMKKIQKNSNSSWLIIFRMLQK